MLQSKYGCRHQYRHLLAITNSFKGSTYGNFRLTESHIATNKPVHRKIGFHIFFNIIGSFQLVGGVFVNKRSFQLGLHIIIGRKSVTLSRFTFGIKFGKVDHQFLHTAFCSLFHFVPCIASDAIQYRRSTVFAHIFRNAMKGMYADIQDIIVFINNLNRFLCLAVHFYFLQTGILTYTVIDMCNIITGL